MSCEFDPIPTWLLKQCLDEVIPLVTTIINRSMESVQICFKRIAEEIWSEHRDIEEIQPVSNLPFVSKILEKAVDARIEHHLVSDYLHELLQSAYRKLHSTETGLLPVNNDILESGSRYCFSACHARPVRII